VLAELLVNMIDTLNFKLNNVSKYPLVKTQYERTSRVGQTTIEIDQDTGEYLENHQIRALLHHDSDSLMSLSKRSSFFIASSHYTVSYFYNISGDYIDFNFSIPKYCYGTNVLQFIKYFDQGANATYDHFMSFLFTFVKKHFIQAIDLEDIEITRLDLCYNQFFNSKYDALKYLSDQKELMKKFARNSKNDFRSYDTSLMYLTKRYSFKIYHKGTEFIKNDRKELLKNNPTGFPLGVLEDQSNRILRYEITFRKSMIDYLFRQNKLENDYVTFKPNQHAGVRKAYPEHYRRAVEFAENGKRYVLAKVDPIEAVHTSTVQFSQRIFNTMFDYFWEYVKKFQLNRKMSLQELITKIDERNEVRDTIQNQAVRRKASYNKPMLTILAMLTSYESLDEIRKKDLVPRSTFFHYQKKLKELGVTSHGRLLDMPAPGLDYSDYKFYFGHRHLN
jgi:hypothetical protein